MNEMLRKVEIGLALLVAVVLGACATQLAPLYDKAIVDGVTGTNASIMELFASVSRGVDSATFDERVEKYNKAIGSIDALAIQARARPIPANDSTETVNDWLEQRGLPSLTDDEVPSAHALAKVSGTLTKMRDTDKKQGLTAVEALAFKNQVSIYMDQAITYEAFLER